MYISVDWVKDFVDLGDLDPKDIGDKITLGTAEVEEIKSIGEHLTKIKVAQIKSLRKHPEADKLNLVTFDFGEDATKEVVCGAPNVREGLKVPYAPIGLYLPAIDLKLEPKKIRGVLSEGMLCSATELGLGTDSDGLLELPDSAPIGQTMLDYLGEKQDTLLDIDNKSLTHRPDLWGHYGFAREFATVYKKALKNPFNDDWKKDLAAKFTADENPVKVTLDGESTCIGYWGLSVSNVKVEESPAWIQSRLNACGLRPINNIVDISNYVMLELGYPNHIYDQKMIEGGEIIVKRIGEEGTFTTLDEVERKLIPTDTMILDTKKSLCLGGIMGGANSGVTEETKDVFLEVANWKPAEVRRTSTRLGLRTDSSQRYEKSLDIKLAERTLYRLLELLLEICPDAKVVGKPAYTGVDLDSIEVLNLTTSAKSICTQLGKEIAEEEIIDIFKRLDFGVQKSGEELLITVPSYRSTKDIDCEADLVEEIGRIIGYDNIIPTSPLAPIKTTRLDIARSLQRKMQDFLIMNARALEVMTYPLVGKKLLEKADWPDQGESFVLINDLSKDHDRMRPSMVPSFLSTIATNTKNYQSFRMFEMGRSYLKDKKGNVDERHQVAIVLADRKENQFVELINIVEDLLRAMNIPFDLAERNDKFANPAIPADWKGTHPNEYLNIRVMGKFAGAITSLHPLMARNFKIKGNVAMAIIDITDVQKRPMKDKTKYTPLSKFPSSTFDCTFVASAKTSVNDILSAFKKVKVKELQSTKVIDVFKLSDEEVTITVRNTFSDPNKTLDGETIKAAENAIISKLADAGYPLKS